MKLTFHVEGMTCAVCSAAVEKVSLRVAGVQSAAVNLATKTLVCECDETTKPEDILKKVVSAGFSPTLLEDKKTQAQTGEPPLRRLLPSVFCLVPLMYLSMAEMLSLPLIPGVPPLVWAAIQVVLAALVLVFCRGFFVRGVKAVLSRCATMDTLVSLGSAAAFLYSIIQIFLFVFGVTETLGALYLDGSAMILVIVTFGKFLENRAKDKTASALNAMNDLLPERVCRVMEDGTQETVELFDVSVGELVLVRTGECVAFDGLVVRGEGSLDTSAVTGESLPRDVQEGDSVISGSVNLAGAFVMRTTRAAKESTLSGMIELVQQAGVTRAPAARLADAVARVFVPTVMLLAFFVTVLWLVLGYDVAFSLGLGISVLVVSCPCALGLATPVAVTAALGTCASKGILVREAGVFETLVKTDTVLLDKTGTVTVGRPRVTDVCSLTEEERFLHLAASIEQLSEHPLARAVCEYVKGAREEVSGFRAVFGRGVEAELAGKRFLMGNAAFLTERGVEIRALSRFSEEMQSQGKTVLYLAEEKTLLGALAVADTVREDAPTCVEDLFNQGFSVEMLTGDTPAAAENIAASCGIETVHASLLPEDKERIVRQKQAEGARVLMMGDGINDAPALLRAEIGVSVGHGTDIAKNAADVLLLSGELKSLSFLCRFARKTVRIIRQNLFWAFFYNCCMIPLAAGALYVPFGLTLNPMIASACMSVSSLVVVTNALRLFLKKEK